MERTFVLDTRNRPRLLIAMMQALAGVGSRISFEGVLSHTELAGMKDVVKDETAVLKRATLQPRLDFVILPLTQESVPAIIRAVVSKIAFGNKGILHVQIEKTER